MSIYSYVVHTLDGVVETGTIEALDARAARAALEESGMDIVELEEVAENFTVVAEPDVAAQLPTVTKPSLVSGAAAVWEKTEAITHDYVPILATVRLYAGWLLAWYFLVYAVGSFGFLERLPATIPYLDELFYSTVILQFSLAAFLLLCLSSVHRLLGGGITKGAVLTVIGGCLLVGFRMIL